MGIYDAYTGSARTQIQKKGTEVVFRTLSPDGTEVDVKTHAIVLPPSGAAELGLTSTASNTIYKTKVILIACVPDDGTLLTYAMEVQVGTAWYRITNKETLAPDGVTDILYYMWGE